MITPLVATGLPLAMQGGAGIDWAQLAQQWIHMRDASPVGMPLAPPPPIIGNVREYHQQAMAMAVPSVVRAGFPLLEEQGEADMDMDDENERGHGAETPPPPAPVVTQSQWLAANETPGQAIDASGGTGEWMRWPNITRSNTDFRLPSPFQLSRWASSHGTAGKRNPAKPRAIPQRIFPRCSNSTSAIPMSRSNSCRCSCRHSSNKRNSQRIHKHISHIHIHIHII